MSTETPAHLALHEAPENTPLLVWIPSTKMWWPGYRSDGSLWSNAHGRLNVEGDKWTPKATAWKLMPPSPDVELAGTEDTTAASPDRPNFVHCIVHGCQNRTDQGTFVGDMCKPCHDYLTSGKIGPTTSFLGQFVREPISECFARLEALRQASTGFSLSERRITRRCRQMLIAVGCSTMGGGDTLLGMTYAACREILRLRENSESSREGGGKEQV